MRLWNTLVFSENYFRLIAQTKKYDREDLRHFYDQSIGNPIEDEENKLLQERRDEWFRTFHPNLDAKEVPLTQFTTIDEDEKVIKIPKFELTHAQKREVRADIWTTDVMHKLWRMMKVRQYEKPLSEQDLLK